MMTGIPVQNLMRGEREKLLHMEEVLSDRVVGQDPAIKVCRHENDMKI